MANEQYFDVGSLRLEPRLYYDLLDRAQTENLSLQQMIRRACRVYVAQATMFDMDNDVPNITTVKVKDGIL